MVATSNLPVSKGVGNGKMIRVIENTPHLIIIFTSDFIVVIVSPLLPSSSLHERRRLDAA